MMFQVYSKVIQLYMYIGLTRKFSRVFPYLNELFG